MKGVCVKFNVSLCIVFVSQDKNISQHECNSISDCGIVICGVSHASQKAQTCCYGEA